LFVISAEIGLPGRGVRGRIRGVFPCTNTITNVLEEMHMGWGRWLLLGDLGQQLDLADHEADIARLRDELQSKQAESESVEHHLAALQRENDELKLYLAAVLRLLVAKNIASIDEIRRVVAAVDREDGIEDQKYSGPLLPDRQ
jgi:hypothetical protein